VVDTHANSKAKPASVTRSVKDERKLPGCTGKRIAVSGIEPRDFFRKPDT